MIALARKAAPPRGNVAGRQRHGDGGRGRDAAWRFGEVTSRGRRRVAQGVPAGRRGAKRADAKASDHGVHAWTPARPWSSRQHARWAVCWCLLLGAMWAGVGGEETAKRGGAVTGGRAAVAQSWAGHARKRGTSSLGRFCGIIRLERPKGGASRDQAQGGAGQGRAR